MTWEIVPESAPGRAPHAPWWALLISGVVVALVGVALLVWPFSAASQLLALLVGAACIANGVAALIGFRGTTLAIPLGVLLIGSGVAAIALPEFTVRVLVSFVALGMGAVGVIWLLLSLRLRSAGAGNGALSVLLPSVLIVLGLAAFAWPKTALVFAAIAVGMVTLLIGLSLIWGAWRLRAAFREGRG